MKIFSGTSNRPLAELICKQLNMELGELYLHTFPSGEKYCQYKTNIRGEDVFLIQSGSNPVNDNLMELLIMCDAARRASAKTITVVCPVFFYQRQERKDKPRVPISAKLVMDMIGCAGATRIVTFDLHAPAVQGFTNLPVDQLSFKPALINALRSYPIDCIVSPDIGAIKRAEEYAEAMDLDLTVISKKRQGDTSVELHQFIGDVTDKNVLIIDDMTESGGTLIQAAKACKDKGAKTVNCAITHGCFTELGVQRLVEAFKHEIIKKLFVSNSIKYTDRWIDPTEQEDDDGTVKGWDYFHIVNVDMAPMFAEAINRINNNQSVTELFK